ncbi:MAG: hypothetical protein FWH40_04485 [Coriobacteriia bacterium]|nr:hypothetical protein [Coriobacteriia bacterium]
MGCASNEDTSLPKVPSGQNPDRLANAAEDAKDEDALLFLGTDLTVPADLYYVQPPGTPLPDDSYLALLVEAVQNVTAHYIGGARDRPWDVQVVVSIRGGQVWAVARSFGDYLGDYGFLVYRVDVVGNGSKLSLVHNAMTPLSPGFSVSIIKTGDAYVVCGAVSNSHWDMPSDGTIDLTGRSYLVAETKTGSMQVPVASKEPYIGYVFILDSEPTDLALYDTEGNPLIVLSERENEIYVKRVSLD